MRRPAAGGLSPGRAEAVARSCRPRGYQPATILAVAAATPLTIRRMIQSTHVAAPDGDRPLAALPAPLPLDELVRGGGPWEVELGFCKGVTSCAAPRRTRRGASSVSRRRRSTSGCWRPAPAGAGCTTS